MKKSILSSFGLLLCAGMLFAFGGKNHKVVKPSVTPGCDTVYLPSSYVECWNGFIYQGYATANQGYGYPQCACKDHGGPYPLLPLE